MSSISVEGKPAAGYMSSHLILIYKNNNGEEFVIRGGPTNDDVFNFGSIKVEVGVAIDESEDTRKVRDENNVVLYERHPDDRGSVVIDFGDLNVDLVWENLLAYAEIINNQNIPYNPLGFNSNTVVGNTLKLVGININDYIPQIGVDLIDYRSKDENFDFDYALNGTFGNDILFGGDGRQYFYSENGNDTLHGGADGDILDGGTGIDTVSYKNSINGIFIRQRPHE